MFISHLLAVCRPSLALCSDPNVSFLLLPTQSLFCKNRSISQNKAMGDSVFSGTVFRSSFVLLACDRYFQVLNTLGCGAGCVLLHVFMRFVGEAGEVLQYSISPRS